jgi:hypothetical protein
MKDDLMTAIAITEPGLLNTKRALCEVLPEAGSTLSRMKFSL